MLTTCYNIHLIFLYSEADLTDADVPLSPLDSTLFPGVSSSVECHDGFANEQAKYVGLNLNHLEQDGASLILFLS